MNSSSNQTGIDEKILENKDPQKEMWVTGVVFGSDNYKTTINAEKVEHQPDDYAYWVENKTYICIRKKDNEKEGWKIYLLDVEEKENWDKIKVQITQFNRLGKKQTHVKTAISGQVIQLKDESGEKIMISLIKGKYTNLLKQ